MKKIVNYIFNIIYNINYRFLMKNCILMESSPDFGDNTRAVFDELINRKINNKYKIIWFVSEKSAFKNIHIKNVKFLNRKKNILNVIIFYYYNIFSKYIIDCNVYIKKRNKNQFRIYLSHGATIKLPRGYCSNIGEVDYIVQISDFFSDINSELFKVSKNKLLSYGFPRNDIFFKTNNNNNIVFPDIKRNKTVFWFPTYRNHKYVKGKECTSNIFFPFGVPTINNEDNLLELNKILTDNGILLIIKLHPVEDSSKISNIELSNIRLINDDFLRKNNTNLYEQLSLSDAMITDYSSLYYDYLLVDKPVALTIPDIDEYKKHVDLLFDHFEENIVGDIVYNFDNLKSFFINLANNIDNSLDERLKKKKIYHKYCDGNATKRIVDLIEKKIR